MTEPSQYFKGRTVQEQMNEVIAYVDTRSAEVATEAIASDVAQVHQDMLDADASADAAAASAASAAGTLANAVKKTGETSQSIDGDIDLNDDLNVDGDVSVGGGLSVTGAITGDDAAFSGDVTVPTEATGTSSTKAANSTKVKNELDNYAPMVRTTGNQNVNGIKTVQKIIGGEVELPYRFRRGKSWLYNNTVKYLRMFRYTTNPGIIIRLNIIWGFNTVGRYGMGDALISDTGICKIDYKGTSTFGPGGLYVCVANDGYTYVIISNMAGYNGVTVEITNCTKYSQNDDIPGFEMLNESPSDTEPVVGDEYRSVYQGSAFS